MIQTIKPKISVITVVYNAKDDLEKTIQSVVSLEYPNVEYVIIDGGSNDGTLEMLHKYQSHIDIFVSEPDKGLYDAMNKGIKKSSGEWLNFMNAGDTFFNPSSLNEVPFHDCSDYSVIYGDTYRRKSRKRTKPFPMSHVGKYGHVMACHQSMFFNKNIIGDELYYDDSMDFSGDSELVTRLYLNDFSFKYVDAVICNFMGEGLASGGNIPLKKKIKARFHYFMYMNKHFGMRHSLALALSFIKDTIFK